MPIYNATKYLDRCIESIIIQTYVNLEIILIDDGSTDESGEICEIYSKKDSRIKLLRQQNEGVSSARNAGIKIASGEWIGFVDADDYIEPLMYEKLLLAAKKTNAQISACGYITTYLDGHVEKTEKKEIPVVMEGLEALEYVLKPNCLEGFLCNKLFHQSLLKNVEKPLCGELYFCEDLLFVVEAFSKSKTVTYVRRAFYHYCMQAQGAMASFNVKRETELEAKQRVLSLVESVSSRYAKYVKVSYVDSAVSMLYAVAKDGEYRQGVNKFLRRESLRYFLTYLLASSISGKRKIRSSAIIIAPRLSSLIWKVVRSQVNWSW